MSALHHRAIEADGIVEGYVTGRLDAETHARFEEHFLDCPQCIAAVEEAEELAAGLRQVARDGMHDASSRAPVRRPSLPLLLAAGLAGVALVLATLLANRQITILEDDLAAARAPQANTPIIRLAVLRSDDGEAVQRIRLGAQPEWWLVTVPAPRAVEGARRALSILRDDGEIIWQTEDAVVDARGELSVSVHSSWLPPGSYRLRAAPLAPPRGLDEGEPIVIRLLIEAPPH